MSGERSTEARRRYQREWKRRKREREMEVRNRSSQLCIHKLGVVECGGRIETVIDRMTGGTLLHCERCERRKAGICRDCPRPVDGTVGRAIRCAECRVAARRDSTRRHRENNRKELNRRARKYARRKATERAEYKRLWRQANPEKVRLQKRRRALRQPAHTYEYLREWRQKNSEQLAAYYEQRRTGKRPPRTCLTPGCTTVLAGRAKKCESCKESARVKAAQELRRAA